MNRYVVTIAHDACTLHEVEAESVSGAIDAAMDEAGVSLCHQCAKEVELGDPMRAVYVENLETGEFNADPDPEYEVVRLRRLLGRVVTEVGCTITSELRADIEKELAGSER